MASQGQSINQTNIGSGIAYSISGDTSISPWSYAFGNSIFWAVQTGTASSIWVKHPAVTCEFWRYDIPTQAWIQLHAVNIGKSNSTIYRVRCSQTPISGNFRYDYNGGDSYLFAFRAYTYEGERSRTTERIYAYNIGADITYDSTVKGKKIYGRNLDQAYLWHYNTARSLTLTDSWLKTDAMAGTQITPALIPRMVSVKSAISFS